MLIVSLGSLKTRVQASEWLQDICTHELLRAQRDSPIDFTSASTYAFLWCLMTQPPGCVKAGLCPESGLGAHKTELPPPLALHHQIPPQGEQITKPTNK